MRQSIAIDGSCQLATQAFGPAEYRANGLGVSRSKQKSDEDVFSSLVILEKEYKVSETKGTQLYFQTLTEAIGKLNFEEVEELSTALLDAYERERTIYIFGNGGSSALASHLVCDLGKGTTNGLRKRFRVMSLTSNVPLITAWANDSCYDDIFAEQLINFVSPGDVAFAISGSGNSPNVLKALEVARENGARTVGLTGFRGGKMIKLCDLCIVVPSDNMQVIEDLHVCVSHAIFTTIREKLCVNASVAFA
jgi:D-sedoheptulose 7-phosphate isomerase